MTEWIKNIVHAGDIVDGHWNTILNRNGRPKELSLTFLPALDNRLWGLKRQKLVVIGGRPSNGKSVILLQTALCLAEQDKNVLFFSFEMSKEVCIERLIALKCDIDNWLLTTGKIGDMAHLPNITQKVDDLSRLLKEKNLIFVDGVGRSLPNLAEIVEISPKPIDALFIDYGNMIDDAPGRTKKQSYDEYLKGLRALAIKNNFCAILGTQINRNVQGKDGIMRLPNLADLKDTGELEQIADMVFLVSWPSLYDASVDKNKYLINVAKNRDGRIGEFWCKFYPEYYKIEEDKNDGNKS